MTDKLTPENEAGISLQFRSMFEGKERTPEAIAPFTIIGAMMNLRMSEQSIAEMYAYFEKNGYHRDRIDEDLSIAGLL